MLEVITATQVVEADLYYKIMEENGLLAKLMMDKLKAFLNNPYFVALERQTILMRFLELHDNMDVIQDLLQFLDKCDLKQDYSTIIMEWTFHNNDLIVQAKLDSLDASGLRESKKDVIPQFEPKSASATDNYVQAILHLTTELLDDNNDDDGTTI